jgi:hypothetical protein
LGLLLNKKDPDVCAIISRYVKLPRPTALLFLKN